MKLDANTNWVAAGEGTAIHVWSRSNRPKEDEDKTEGEDKFKFHCYLNPRNRENVRRVQILRTRPDLLASIDYKDNVFLWDIKAKTQLLHVPNRPDACIFENPLLFGVASQDQVTLYDITSDGVTEMRDIQLKEVLSIDKISWNSYRLIQAAASASEVHLCFNHDIVTLDFWQGTRWKPTETAQASQEIASSKDEAVVGTKPKKSILGSIFGKKKPKEEKDFSLKSRQEKLVHHTFCDNETTRMTGLKTSWTGGGMYSNF